MDLTKLILDNASVIASIIISAIISFILGILTVTQITQKSIQYELKNRLLISENVARTPELKIMYGGVEVNNFSSAIVNFYNTGYNAIKGTDISSNEPIRITIEPHCKFLYAEVIAASDNADGFQVIKEDENHLKITFEHLNQKEWGRISLLHTGNHPNLIKIEGKIIGGNHISEYADWLSYKKNATIISIVIGLLLGIFGSWLLNSINPPGSSITIFQIIVIILAFIGLLSLGFVILIVYGVRSLKNR